MGKFDFIKEGNVLFWHVPDNGPLMEFIKLFLFRRL